MHHRGVADEGFDTTINRTDWAYFQENNLPSGG
jgi:hypothetical protein